MRVVLPHKRPAELLRYLQQQQQQQQGEDRIVVEEIPRPNNKRQRKNMTASLYPDERDSAVLDNEPPPTRNNNNSSSNNTHHRLLETLAKKGLELVPQEGDGNCLIRAVALQVYGDASLHPEVRQRCLDFMQADAPHFATFISNEESFAAYIARKRQLGVHGNHTELQAMAEVYNRPVQVWTDEGKPLNIFHTDYKTDQVPIRLSYHDGNHYNAIVDPLVPTAGLGLGLPNLQLGLADRQQVAKAVEESDLLADEAELQRVLQQSEDDQLRRVMMESAREMESVCSCDVCETRLNTDCGLSH